MAEAAKSLKVFVSYSRTDVDFADQLVLALEDKGFEAILDRHDMSGGENWRERLGKLILSADAVAFILTPKSAASEICAWEVEEARRLGKRILPVTPGSIVGATPPAALGDLNWIPFYAEPTIPGSGFYYGVKRLTEALSIDLDWLRAQTRYSERAQEWSRARPEDLLLRGEALKEAEGWLARTPSGAHPPDLVREYLAAGGNAEQHRQAAAKAQLEEREQALKTAEAAVTEKQEAIAEKVRIDRRLRVLAVTALAAGLVLVASALWGLWYAGAKSAEAGQRRADLFAQTSSQLLRDGDRALAMLVAVAGDPGAEEGLFPGLFKPDGYLSLRAALVRAHANDLLVHSMVVPRQTAFASLRDGKRFVIASIKNQPGATVEKGQLQIWEGGNSNPLLTVETDKAATAIIALSNTDELLILWRDTTASIWSISRKTVVRELGLTGIGVIAANIEGNIFVTSSGDGKVKLWEADQAAPREEFDIPNGAAVTALAVETEYGRVIAGVTIDDRRGRLVSWDFSEPAPEGATDLETHVRTIMAADGLIMAGLESGRLVAWDGDDEAPEGVQGFMGELGEDAVGVDQLTFFEAEGILMISTNGDAQFISPAGVRPLLDGGAKIVDGGFLTAAHQLVTVSEDGLVQTWSLNSSTKPSDLINAPSDGYTLLGMGGGSVVIAGSGKWKLRQAGGAFEDAPWTPLGEIWTSAVSSDGTLFAASTKEGADLVLWKVGEPKPILQLPKVDAAKRTLDIHFQPGSTRFLTVSEDAQVRVWEPGVNEPVATYQAPEDGDKNAPRIVRFMPDGEHVLTARSEHIELWRLGGSAPELDLGATARLDAVAVDTAGERIAIATRGQLQVYGVDGTRLQAFAGHKQDVSFLTFHKDGKLLLSGSADGSLRLWSLGEREEVQRFDVPSFSLDAVDFDADGRSVLVSFDDARIIKFPIDPIVFAGVDEQLRLACERVAERGLEGFTPQDRDRFPILESVVENNPCARRGYPVVASPAVVQP